MAHRYKAAPADGTVIYHLAMTQAQLADATGLTSVHVNRSLKALRSIGTFFYHGKVRIEDWHALVTIGDFNAGYLQDEILPEQRIRLVH